MRHDMIKIKKNRLLAALTFILAFTACRNAKTNCHTGTDRHTQTLQQGGIR